MKLAVPNARIVQIDLTMHTDEILRGYVLAWAPGDNRAEFGADYVTWRVQYAPIADSEIDCESGNYFHLSPGWSDDQQILALSQAQADYNDRRGVQLPPF